MYYVHFRPLNVIMTFRSKKGTEMSELRCDALHLQSLIHGNIWESLFRGKKKKQTQKELKNDCFKNTNKWPEHAQLVNIGYV